MTVLLWLLGAAALTAAAGVAYQAAGERRDARRYPAPGRMITAATTSIHVHEAGSRGTPVVFEAGIAASSMSWQRVQPRIAEFARTISYDRPGLGYSAATPRPRTLSQLADDLHEIVNTAGVERPFVLVAHSFGAAIALAYLRRFSTDVKGLLLVDPVSLEEWCSRAPAAQIARLRRGVALSRRGALLARIGVVRLALTLAASGARRVPRAIAKASSGHASVITERMASQVGKLPPEWWPAIRAHWSSPRAFKAMAAQLDALPECLDAAGSIEELPQVRAIVLSGSHLQASQLEEHRRLGSRLGGEHRSVPGAGHWIQLDAPDEVIRAVSELAE